MIHSPLVFPANEPTSSPRPSPPWEEREEAWARFVDVVAGRLGVRRLTSLRQTTARQAAAATAVGTGVLVIFESAVVRWFFLAGGFGRQEVEFGQAVFQCSCKD